MAIPQVTRPLRNWSRALTPNTERSKTIAVSNKVDNPLNFWNAPRVTTFLH